MVTSSDLATLNDATLNDATRNSGSEVSRIQTGHTWQNQAGTARAMPSRVARPTTVDELVAAMCEAVRLGANVRPVGSGLAISALAAAPDALIDTSELRGFVSIDEAAGTATFLAGTTVNEAATVLEGYEMSFVGAPGNGEATLAGALATGAHGYAPREGSFSAMVAGLSLVTPNGELIRISEHHNAQYWGAARLNLGALGVVAEVTVRIRPFVELRTSRKRRNIDDLMADLSVARDKVDFYRVDWRPRTDDALLTVGWLEAASPASVPTRAPERREVRRRGEGFRVRLARALPFLAPVLDAVTTRLEPTGDRGVRAARDIMEAGPAAPFVEYQFPLERGPVVVNALRAFVEESRGLAQADVRITIVAADDVWLSAAYGRDVVSVSVRVPSASQKTLLALEDLFIWLGGLPAWGGFHTMTGPEAAYVMPRFSDFQHIRADLDPYGRMENSTLRRLRHH